MENMTSLGIRFVYFFTLLGLSCRTSSYLAQVTIMKEVFKVSHATVGKKRQPWLSRLEKELFGANAFDAVGYDWRCPAAEPAETKLSTCSWSRAAAFYKAKLLEAGFKMHAPPGHHGVKPGIYLEVCHMVADLNI